MKKGPVVGVRELRAHLSAYLRDVARGETVTIGDRKRQPIAQLVPVERDPAKEHLDQLARDGRVRLGTGPKPGGFRGVKPRPGSRLLSDVVIENRRMLYLDTSALAEAHALLGYDAVQLAAALQARAADGDYRFAAFDGRLNAAAAREGLRLTDVPDVIGERPVVAYGRPFRTTRRQVAASGSSR